MSEGVKLGRAAVSPATWGETSAERCPVCRAKIVVRLSSEVVIRNAILRVHPATGRVSAKCSRCKSWVKVPLRFLG